MKKLYQRINWQNYPSDSTPLNESNLNKMDAAVDGIDDRVVTLDVTKLPVATANTMVKDVTFNESTGVFTITKLNGTKVTVNTALEKIATNFRFDHSTQKLILTLIDGTTQEVDLSALLTQYEFLNSSTIQFTIDSSGKVKASVVNGSITGDMLEPNYLANVTLQASKADTSAKNAKESEGKAAEYAENAKNSADSAEPVASTATGTNPTAQNSTNAPLIYGKFKGYTEQMQYSGKNLLNMDAVKTQTVNGVTFTLNEDGSVIVNGTATENAFINYGYADIASNTEYILSGCPSGGGGSVYKIGAYKTNYGNNWTGNDDYGSGKTFTETENIRYYISIAVYSGQTVNNLRFYPMIRLASETDATYEPYVGGTASPNPDYPQEISGLAKDGAIEVKTTRKNVLNRDAIKTGTLNGITYTLNEDGSVIVNGTATEKAFINYGYADIASNTEYILSGCPSGGGGSVYKIGAYKTNYGNNWADNDDYGSGKTFTETENIRYYIAIAVYSGQTVNNLRFYPMIRPAEIADATYEPYTEITAAIPTDAPLYEGDYLEVYADGSGKESHKMKSVDMGSLNWGYDNEKRFVAYIADKTMKYTIRTEPIYCDIYTSITDGRSFESVPNFSIYGSNTNGVYVHDNTYTDVTDFKNAVKGVMLVYELATPTETPLTAEQVEQFKKLYTFEPVTNVLCDGKVEIRYYKNTPSGVAVGTVHRMADNNKATYDGDGNVITETYAKQTDLEKVIDGTTTVAKATSATTSTKATQDGSGNNIVNTYAKKTSVLSTVSQCTASTNINDIAGASALAEMSDFLDTKTLINSGGNDANVLTNNGFTLFIVPYVQSGWKYSTKIENAWYFVLSYRLNADSTTQHWFGLTSRFNYYRITRDGGTTWNVYAFESIQK